MKKLLPPYLFLISIVVMALVCWSLGSPHLIGQPAIFFGGALVLAGIGLAAKSSALFRKEQTNIMTFGEPDKLVTTGAFKYTRNPMYLGFTVALVGFAILFGAAISSFAIVGLFILIADRWYIAFEENMMRSKFGEEYEDYSKSVRRWI
ncbi:Putative protein-S-isoprenylcysteine methyltransferase [Vibrio nigripulchritudo SFn27]|uniref:Steroid 5-alpha reductase C-terminal domain-containing protein n=1 Tax=Vibrio nigripulchritudo TaxID=28173 RepID=U4K7U5_9VIBR|nr:isoprenylcysteine carboxylmethyltransferase family protein [Vibrio nigripulchritudo]CCN83055.1 Putative protein-S-isoprenylcysteine methyltransferase [Vibrio nigripulchritudo BLFn1]CCN90677.1 Putative protein-S-isoprenylcysteine methyltransferase [Vibrio nigripulchritudo SFn27]CCN97264.1 Putative protein-S-isoprenylcysteine methyltransferase [Vibrio nigripulchritudo ENn2]CCO39900.1 Putative protein-S-isoprenylcysteine methyltransferase [Vibrio nigripulchritudo SFn135]CCO51040.1 Putative pro